MQNLYLFTTLLFLSGAIASENLEIFLGEYELNKELGFNVSECQEHMSVYEWLDGEITVEFEPARRESVYFNEINESADATRYDGFYLCYKTTLENQTLTTYITKELAVPVCLFREYYLRESLQKTADGLIYRFTDYKKCFYLEDHHQI